ncbi:MAG: prephenate dehydrogenase/arogenate dehydrogenase family protein [Limnoraphis sp. WC205]|jgi:prephenate dehydrogenase/chorismate mutase/prephenate dehydrogenase|nr:prephenate dehydrogenase/arogenate dehydrogenase family protein [Limnoraphis sp. WC205]
MVFCSKSPSKLEDIDRQLVKLLGERIAAIAEEQSNHMNSTVLKTELDQAGVPEFVWRNLLTSAAAAATISPSVTEDLGRTDWPQQVTLIGGTGKMGQFFAEQITHAGHQVRIMGRDDWDDAEVLLGNADLVMVCVPTQQAVSVIKKAASYLRETTALTDIISIKAPIVEAMLTYHSGPVMGLHPMFGPGIGSFLSQNVVVCPGRSESAFDWLLRLIERNGGKLRTSSATEHDRMMGTVQGIRHFMTFGLGVFLATEGVDVARSLELSSPLYRLAIAQASRLFAQNDSLCLEIMMGSPESRGILQRLSTTYAQLASAASCCDRDSLKRAFEIAHQTFQTVVPQTLPETDHIIESLSVFLAASTVESPEADCVQPSMQPPRKLNTIVS